MNDCIQGPQAMGKAIDKDNDRSVEGIHRFHLGLELLQLSEATVANSESQPSQKQNRH